MDLPMPSNDIYIVDKRSSCSLKIEGLTPPALPELQVDFPGGEAYGSRRGRTAHLYQQQHLARGPAAQKHKSALQAPHLVLPTTDSGGGKAQPDQY